MGWSRASSKCSLKHRWPAMRQKLWKQKLRRSTGTERIKHQCEKHRRTCRRTNLQRLPTALKSFTNKPCNILLTHFMIAHPYLYSCNPFYCPDNCFFQAKKEKKSNLLVIALWRKTSDWDWQEFHHAAHTTLGHSQSIYEPCKHKISPSGHLFANCSHILSVIVRG